MRSGSSTSPTPQPPAGSSRGHLRDRAPRCHGYLPEPFLPARLNTREDRYGGSLEHWMRFTVEAYASCARR